MNSNTIVRRLLAYTLPVLAAAVTGCAAPETGSGPIPTDGPDRTAPSIVSMSPSHGSVGVEPTSEITIVFNEEIDASTAIPTLVLDGTAVDIEVEHQGSVVVIRPAAPLALEGTYQVMIPETMADLAGNVLGESVDAAFTVRPGSWTAGDLHRGVAGATGVRTAALGDTGAAIAIWQQTGGLHASRTLSFGWESPTQLSGAMAETAVISASAAAGVATWSETGADGYSHVYAARFSPVTGWSAKEQIDAGAHAFSPAATVDALGVVTLAWAEAVFGADSSLMVRRFVPDLGWQAAVVVYSGPQAVWSPSLAAVGQGAALTWTQDDGASSLVWFTRCSGNAPCDTAETLSNAAGWSFSPRLAANEAGITVAWNELAGFGIGVVVRAASEQGWSDTSHLGSTDAYAEAPRVTMDETGAAMVVWASWGTTAEILASRGGVDGFGELTRLDVATTGASPEVAFSGSRIIATWEEQEALTVHIGTRTFSGSWSALANLGEGSAPSGAMIDGGRAVTLWNNGDVLRFARFE